MPPGLGTSPEARPARSAAHHALAHPSPMQSLSWLEAVPCGVAGACLGWAGRILSLLPAGWHWGAKQPSRKHTAIVSLIKSAFPAVGGCGQPSSWRQPGSTAGQPPTAGRRELSWACSPWPQRGDGAAARAATGCPRAWGHRQGACGSGDGHGGPGASGDQGIGMGMLGDVRTRGTGGPGHGHGDAVGHGDQGNRATGAWARGCWGMGLEMLGGGQGTGTGRDTGGGPGDGQGAPGSHRTRGMTGGPEVATGTPGGVRGPGQPPAAVRAVGGGPVPSGAGGGAAGAGATGPGRERRRDAAELPLAMGGGCRARTPAGAGLRRAGLRLLLAHAVLLCAAGSAAADGSGTRGGGRHREGGRGREREREGDPGKHVPGSTATSRTGGGSGTEGTRGARRDSAPGGPVPGGRGNYPAPRGGGPRERGGTRHRGMEGDLVPEGPVPAVPGPRRRRGRGAVAGRCRGVCPKLLPGAAGPVRVPPGPRGGMAPIAPGWSCRDPAVGRPAGAPERRAGRAGQGQVGNQEPRGHRLGQSPRSTRSRWVWPVTPDRRTKSPMKNKLPLYLPLRPWRDHTQGLEELSLARVWPRLHDRAGLLPRPPPSTSPWGRTGPRPPQDGPITGLRGSTRLFPEASQLGRSFSKEREAISMSAGSQGPSPLSPNTYQVKLQFGGEDGGLGAAGMALVA